MKTKSMLMMGKLRKIIPKGKGGKVSLDAGMKIATRFFLAIMTLGILGFALIIVLGNLFDAANDALPAISQGTTNNETTTNLNETGALLSVSNLNAVACSVDSVNNATGVDGNFDLNNFTITNCLIASNSVTDAGINNTVINVTYSHSTKDDAAVNALSNLTQGGESFFSNANSWFTLLSVIIIIAIVSVVISVVRSTKRKESDI